MITGKKLSDVLSTHPLNYEIVYRIHATKRMFQRSISEEDAEEVLCNGHIIEDYPDDYPFPSVLMNGLTKTGKYIHCVAGIDYANRRIYIITLYDPDADKWLDTFSKRKHT